MISALLGIYAAGTLGTAEIPATTPHVMPWNETVLEVTAVPNKNDEFVSPVIEAKAAIVVDLQNGLVLYEKNIHDQLPIASLTKLMTAIVVLEENDIKEEVTVSANAANGIGAKVWLAEGEKISVENLLYAALIPSANDAAIALAEHNSGTIDDFVNKMNKKAKNLGLYSTQFLNPTGLDGGSISEGNISTAYDVTLLGRYAYGKSFVRRAAAKKEMQIASSNTALTHDLKNTNKLLDSFLNVLGLKTGTTDSAGECLVAIFQNEEGNDIMTVVLNSPARYAESKLLADWTFRAYNW